MPPEEMKQQAKAFKERNHAEEELIGVEVIYADFINQLLKGEKNNQPIIILDIGGLGGISWCKLAHHFKEQVKNNLLAFVVTNIESCADQKDVLKGPLGEAKKTVHYVTTDTGMLKNLSISIGDTKVPITGNVGFAHERCSVLAHSMVPEIDIPRVAATLSERGIYHIEDSMISTMFGTKYANQRLAAGDLAFKDIRDRFQMQMVEEVEAGSKKGEEIRGFIFRKPNGPVVRVG